MLLDVTKLHLKNMHHGDKLCAIAMNMICDSKSSCRRNVNASRIASACMNIGVLIAAHLFTMNMMENMDEHMVMHWVMNWMIMFANKNALMEMLKQ